MLNVLKIVSGGQAGVDRAALDAALESGIPIGGWCPRGRRAEDGVVPERYPLQETRSTDYRVRTERNILESDGTLVVCLGRPRGGTDLTLRLALRHGKPLLKVDLAQATSPVTVRTWIEANAIGVLNVAGPRESHAPGIHAEALSFLRSVLVSDRVCTELVQDSSERLRAITTGAGSPPPSGPGPAGCIELVQDHSGAAAVAGGARGSSGTYLVQDASGRPGRSPLGAPSVDEGTLSGSSRRIS